MSRDAILLILHGAGAAVCAGAIWGICAWVKLSCRRILRKGDFFYPEVSQN